MAPLLARFVPDDEPRALNTRGTSHAPGAPSAGRARVESLLRAKKLDRTLTSIWPDGEPLDRGVPWDVATLDAALHGGLKRGQLSEIVGPVSSGRTGLALGWLAAATQRREQAALIDTFDRFDVASGARCGIVLPRLLWIRGQPLSKTTGTIDPAWLPGVRAVSGPGTLLERTIDRALKALNLVLHAQVCTAVVLDLADVPASALRSIPASTWMRLQRVIEGSDTACLLLAPLATARSVGGITINTGARSTQGPQRTALESSASWIGGHDRQRRLGGVHLFARLISPRRSTTTHVTLTAQMDPTI